MSQSSPASEFGAIIIAAAIVGCIAVLFSVLVAIIPFAIVGFLILRAWRNHQNSPEKLEAKSRKQCEELRDAVAKRVGLLLDSEQFAGEIYQKLPELPKSLDRAFINAALQICDAENFTADLPDPPPICNSVEGARYKDTLNAIGLKLGDPAAVRVAQEVVLSAFQRFIGFLPKFGQSGEVWGDTPAIDVIAKKNEAVECLIIDFYCDAGEQRGLFKDLRWQLDENLHQVSKVPHRAEFAESPKLILPTAYTGEKVAEAYLKDTPLLRIAKAAIPFTVPIEARFEHHHIVAGSGHGKTQTLQYLIARDLEAVERGERSIVVIDSQGDLISKIAQLQIFAPGEPLHDKLCIIDPTDIEWPVSLNLFDVGQERLNTYPMLERERLTNSILELYDFVLGSLLSAEMTQKQNVIFRYVTRLMLHIPNATIHTLRELMEPNSFVRFAEHISKLDGTARHFFETEFNSPEFKRTKTEVLRRLWGILENRTFERMFSHPRSKLDLQAELNAGKVILINTAKDLLKASGTEIFGRFFIALIAQAAQERAILPESKRLPTFVYVDEASEYFDRNIETILTTARKYKIGMVLAHQYLSQLDPKLREAFAANTAIKFAGGGSPQDAKAMAQMIGCDAELITAQPKMSFVASIRGVTKNPLPLRFPAGHLEDLPKMDRKDVEQVKARMRNLYAVHHTELDGVDSYKETNVGAGSADERRGTDRSGYGRGKDTGDKANPPDGIIPKPPSDPKTKKSDRKRKDDDPDLPDTGPSEKW